MWPRRVAVPLRAWLHVGPPRPAWARRLPSHCTPVAPVRPLRCCLHAWLAVWLGQNLEQSTKKNQKIDSLSCAAVALHAPRLGVALHAHAPVVLPTRCVCTWSVGPEKKTFSTKK